MTDESTTVDATATTTPDMSATSETYINPDGSFKEGWQGHIIPQDIYKRNKMTMDGMKSVGDLFTHINNQDLTISRQGKGIFPPGENAKDFEIKAFHKALGVPDTPSGYTLNIPKEVEKYYQDAELMDEAKVIFHREGITPRQFAAIMALDAKRMQQSEQALQDDPVAFYEEIFKMAGPVMAQQAEKKLREKWGDNYDARLQLANAAITENTTEGEEREQLLMAIGNNALAADLLATIQQRHHTESSGIDTSLGYGAQYMNVDQQIKALMSNPHYLDGKTNPAEHTRLINEVHRLMNQKTGGKMLE